MKLCECGTCRLEVTKEGNRFILGHNSKVNPPLKDPEVAKKSGDSRKGQKREDLRGEKNPSKRSVIREKIGDKLRGRKNGPHSEKRKIKIGKGNKERWKEDNNRRIKQRKLMFSGQAVWMNQFIKNPSKPQVEIWKMVTRICPYVYLNFPVNHLEKQVNLDIAIPKLEICIEYNEPTFHGEVWGNKEEDNKRQKMLEEEGWKVLNYYPIPTFEKIKKDISKILGDNTCE